MPAVYCFQKAGAPPIARGPRCITWDVGPRDPEFEANLATKLALPKPLLAVLRNRGLTTPAAIQDYLSPSLDSGLHDPFLLPDMGPAAERLVRALDAGEQVLVHGDYDADGVTSAALLVRVLSRLGGNVRYFVPHRFHDHYGLSERAVRTAARKGVGLVVGLDCGVSDHDAVAAARDAGTDVIVVDHHQPGASLPDGAIVVNPKREDATYPFEGLTAVGLTYKLAAALCQLRGIKEEHLARAFLDLVTVGTIADVAPLVGENRVLCAAGLSLLPRTRKAGLRALLQSCQLDGRTSASDVAFRIAPRLNAVGRMGDAHQALELLLTDDEEQALRLALTLDALNRQRQREQEKTYAEARRAAEDLLDAGDHPVLVVAADGWHLGVVGIVASKLVEDFGRPAIVIAQEDGLCRGSARSVEGFDIAAALGDCGDLLERCGGHALAGGLTVRRDLIPALRLRLCELAESRLSPQMLERRLPVDCEIAPEEITPELARALAGMEPCGQDNPAPTFMTAGVEVVSVRRVGRDGDHLKLTVASDKYAFDAIGFGMGREGEWLRPRMRLDLAHAPELNEFNGSIGLQLRLAGLRQSVAGH
ncbi:MAG: single-stranded-DNA-specific exonuclease RecJ [Armatimonadetes bacterium]|nr:single-stranded-DNA-specific exonuclease RecJ [Armatimonadota bacterium]